MKQIAAGLLILLSQLAHASLVDEVDQLTPEEAYLFSNKLQAKVLQPVPESFFTRLSVSVGGGIGVIDPSTFNSYLAPNQAKLDAVGAWKVNLLWKLDDHFLLGLSMNALMAQQTHEPSANVFHDLSVFAPALDAAFGYRFDLSDSVFLAPTLGIGVVSAMVREEFSNDTTRTTYVLRYSGSAFHLMAELPIYFRLNRVWSIGLTHAFQLGNITSLNRKEDRRVSVPNLSVTGYQGTLSFAFNL